VSAWFVTRANVVDLDYHGGLGMPGSTLESKIPSARDRSASIASSALAIDGRPPWLGLFAGCRDFCDRSQSRPWQIAVFSGSFGGAAFAQCAAL